MCIRSVLKCFRGTKWWWRIDERLENNNNCWSWQILWDSSYYFISTFEDFTQKGILKNDWRVGSGGEGGRAPRTGWSTGTAWDREVSLTEDHQEWHCYCTGEVLPVTRVVLNTLCMDQTRRVKGSLEKVSKSLIDRTFLEPLLWYWAPDAALVFFFLILICIYLAVLSFLVAALRADAFICSMWAS